MKKLLFLAGFLFLLTGFLLAQKPIKQNKAGKAPQFAKQAEKTVEKLNKELKLSKASSDSLKKIFTKFFVERQRIKQVLVQEKLKENLKKRDESVKKILNAEQFKKYQAVIQKQMKEAKDKQLINKPEKSSQKAAKPLK
jgi:hypothetical protein